MYVALLAMASCLPCHEAVVRAFAATGMGQSITKPTAEARQRQEGRHGSTTWMAAWNGSTLIHRAGDESRTVDWAVGSGRAGKSYLVRVGDALFQSPLAWYARRGTWDLSPGYSAGTTIDFLRPITADCLFCHAGTAAPVPGTVNRYAAVEPIPEPAIGCARCHGQGDAHAKAPQPGNIVNPAKLSPTRRDSVCEQCHLSGAARIPLPGKSFSDFRPGMALEEVFSVYLPSAGNGLKVVSHAEQLALSRCAVESAGRLWCGSCHDAHREPADTKRWYASRCTACHSETKAHGDDCAKCHMPRTQTYDGGHTAFTDHRIRKPGDAPAQAGRTAGLRVWREPAAAFRARGLGLAYAGVGELETARDLLRGVREDGEVQAALGMIYLSAGQADRAVRALESAAKSEPGSATRRLNFAAALLGAGQRERAKEEALQAVTLEPLLQDGYVLLAEIEPRRAAYWRERFAAQMRRR